MPRRLLLAVALVATLLAACGGGTPSASPLTDPKDILAKAVSSLQTLKTVHVKATLAGKIDPGLATGGSGGIRIDLTGSSLEGDIDRASSAAKVSVTVPALFGFSLDAVASGGTAWAKTSLNQDGKYRKVELGSILSGLPLPGGLLPSSPPAAASATPDPSAVAAMIDQFKAQLDKLTTPPLKLADEKIGDQDCYHVQAKIGPADLPQASGLASLGSITVDAWTRKSDYRPARLVVVLDAGAQGSLTATVDLSSYDAAVTISAPPADQVSDEPFTIPGLFNP